MSDDVKEDEVPNTKVRAVSLSNAAVMNLFKLDTTFVIGDSTSCRD